MAKRKKAASGRKRAKVRENKTVKLPEPLKELPELQEIGDLPEIEPFPEEEGKGLFKGLFRFGKKEKAEEIKKEKPAEDKEFSKPLEAPEPDFLKEIDLGHADKVEPELALWLNDGRVVKNLEELARAFKTMKSRIFQQHREKNDISAWVRDVIGNPQIASQLASAKTKNDAAKILENDGKSRRKKTKKEEKEAAAAEKDSTKLEIQKAIENISYKTGETAARAEPLKEREKKLEEKERLLELEEEHINRKRIELANKRYRLIKERGEIEKEKFEKMLKSHGTPEETVPHDYAGMPQLELEAQYSKEKIESLVEETRRAISQGQVEEAKHLVEELKTALEFTEIPARDSKKLEYDVLELEADLKLATLV